jgi:hypothetical protein
MKGKVTRVGASERAANEFQLRKDGQTHDHERQRLQMVPGWRTGVFAAPRRIDSGRDQLVEQI